MAEDCFDDSQSIDTIFVSRYHAKGPIAIKLSYQIGVADAVAHLFSVYRNVLTQLWCRVVGAPTGHCFSSLFFVILNRDFVIQNSPLNSLVGIIIRFRREKSFPPFSPLLEGVAIY